tara:strand:- start:11765 stop:12439 length:675 start_codon:yes stop_codon:yes gene_type:complete
VSPFRKKLFIALIGLVCSPCLSYAVEDGFYATLGLGAGRISGKPDRNDFLDAGLAATGTFDEGKRFTPMIEFSVGYQANLSERFTFGTEAGYKFVHENKMRGSLPGTIDDGDIKQELDIFDLLLVGNFHIDEKIAFFVKGGMAFVVNKLAVASDFSTNVAGLTLGTFATPSAFSPEAAMGFSYAVSRNLQLLVTASHVFGEPFKLNEAVVPGVTLLTVGIKFSL